jgi:hypothetical protein
VSTDEILTLPEAYELIEKYKVPKSRHFNKPQAVIWTRHSNQIEVCFDLKDIALQTGMSAVYINKISTGMVPPPQHFMLMPLPNTKLVGYTRPQIIECYLKDKFS